MIRTAISLTPDQIEAYRRSAVTNKPEHCDEIKGRRLRAWSVAKKAAKILKSEFGAEKVIVFGSLIHPNLFHPHSDVDLAVWGLLGRDYYRAVSILLDIDSNISIDLIAFEEARLSVKEVILQEGQDL